MVLTNLIFSSPVFPTEWADSVIHPNEENNLK